MNNAIHVGGAYGLESLISGMQKKASQTASNLSYKDMLASIQAQAEPSEENVIETKSTADMTMEEYRTYIWRTIDSFPFSPTRPFDEETIKISDKCWNRMKSDPEYEKKMMDIIKDGRQYPDPFFGMGSSGAYSVLEFDGGEGCHSHTWSKNFGGSRSGARKQFERESEGGFWTIREKRAKLQAELDAKYYEKKEMLQEINDHLDMLRESGFLGTSQTGMPETVTSKRFMPDGTIIITTKKDGKIVEQHKKKPHLVPVPDGLTGKIKMEPFQSVFELMA